MSVAQVAETPLLSVRDLCKSFGPVQAVDHVSLDIYPREIVGLVGDNGAGKSTLLSLLSGFYTKDSGTFLYQGREVSISSPRTARRHLKIEMIYQNLSLAPDLTVWENAWLGQEQLVGGVWLNKGEMISRTDDVLKRLNSKVRATDIVGNLSGGEQQLVAISRALLFERDLIIMDEPTAAISLSKVHEVLELILTLKKHGKSVILVSHRLEDILKVADRIVILSLGHVRDILVNRDLTIEHLVRAIFGSVEGMVQTDEPA